MLLDRKRINKWAKWGALALAIVFAVSFVAMGVGSGTGLDFSQLWTSNDSSGGEVASLSPEEQITAYQEMLATNPDDTDALLGIANLYRDLGQPLLEASYLEKLAQLEAGEGEIHMRLASVYLDPDVADYGAAARVLKELTALDPNNAEAFLQLGIAERSAGNINGAILAWNRYLQLDPDGEMAETVAAELEQLTPSTTEASAE